MTTASGAAMRRLIWPGLTAVLMLLILLGLGTWQVQRLHWKEALLARIAAAEAGPAVPPTAQPTPYAKIAVTGRFRHDLVAFYGVDVRDTRSGPQMGTFLIEPLDIDNAPPLLVDRGWVPLHRNVPTTPREGEVTVEGYVHPAERPGLFSAKDDPTTRTFYTLEPAAIGRSLGLRQVAPFVLVALGQVPPESWPDPAKHLPRPPNNHLSYAITWYGLAAALVVIFVVWARRTLRA